VFTRRHFSYRLRTLFLGAPSQRCSIVRVLIADDVARTRAALRDLLEISSLVRVCGEAASASEAITMAVGLKPDVVILDLRMPGGNGIEAASRISAILPGTPIALISIYPGLKVDGAASDIGVSRFFCKDELGNLCSWIESLEPPRHLTVDLHSVRAAE